MPQLLLTLIFIAYVQPALLRKGEEGQPVAVGASVMRQNRNAVTPAHYKGRQVQVGNGGGMTGLSTTYYMLDNGQLFARRSNETSFTFIGQQTKPNTRRIFDVVETKCSIKTTTYNNPGNTYKFVGWQQGAQRYEVKWGGTKGAVVPPNYPKFYDSFFAMIPASLRLK